MKTINKAIVSFALVFMVAVSAFLFMACGAGTPKLTLQHEFKTAYYVGEQLDVTDGTLLYESGKDKSVVEIEEYMVSDFTTQTVGARNLKITYRGLSILVPYTVSDYIGSITLEKSFQTEYFKNDALNVEGGQIKFTQKTLSGETQNETVVPITEQMIRDFDSSQTGSKEMTINYNGYTLMVPYTVKPWQLIQGMAYKSEYSRYVHHGGLDGDDLETHWFNVVSVDPLGNVQIVWYRTFLDMPLKNNSQSMLDRTEMTLRAVKEGGYLDHYEVTLNDVTVDAYMVDKNNIRIYGTISYENQITKIDRTQYETWTLNSPIE